MRNLPCNFAERVWLTPGMKTIFLSRIALALGFTLAVGAPFTICAEDAGKSGARDGDRAALREKLHARLLEKFDANHNGKLDPEEREAAMKAFKERRGKGGKSGGGEFKRRKPGTDESAAKQ